MEVSVIDFCVLTSKFKNYDCKRPGKETLSLTTGPGKAILFLVKLHLLSLTRGNLCVHSFGLQEGNYNTECSVLLILSNIHQHCASCNAGL